MHEHVALAPCFLAFTLARFFWVCITNYFDVLVYVVDDFSRIIVDLRNSPSHHRSSAVLIILRLVHSPLDHRPFGSFRNVFASSESNGQ
jgi:hypothetical protein